MKFIKCTAILIAVTLLFAGCGKSGTRENAEALNSDIAELPGLYTESEIETATSGAIRSYPVGDCTEFGYFAVDDEIYLVKYNGNTSENDGSTTITRLAGNNLHTVSETTLSGRFESGNFSVSSDKSTFSYCSYGISGNCVYTFYDENFIKKDEITVTDSSTGTALISPDMDRLYYCTDDSVICENVSTKEKTVISNGKSSWKHPEGLMFGGKYMRYYTDEDGGKTVIVDTSTGKTAKTLTGIIGDWFSDPENYFCSNMTSIKDYIFGKIDGESKQIYFRELVDSSVCDVDFTSRKVLVSRLVGSGTELECYNLSSGKRLSFVSLPEITYPSYSIIADGGKYAWFADFDKNTIFRLEFSKSPSGDDKNYISAVTTKDKPDTEGFAVCRTRADALEKEYGVDILMRGDTDFMSDSTYKFTHDWHPVIYERLLDGFENAAKKLPQGFLKLVADKSMFKNLTVVLTYGIEAKNDSSLSSVIGYQYFGDKRTYLVIANSNNIENTVYHELFHAIDSAVRTTNDCYDKWNDLNPKGAKYDYDYKKNAVRTDSEWLDGKDAAFIDMYSLSYPTEDRARIFEYACSGDNRFTTPVLKKKLKMICDGIRINFTLPDNVLWEQYLD